MQKIRKHTLNRLRIDATDEEESEDRFERTPYRKQTIPEDFTPTCKRFKSVVPSSDGSSASEMKTMMMMKVWMRKKLHCELQSVFIKLAGKLFRAGARARHYQKLTIKLIHF
jgi:hypothetical protein